MKLKCGNKCFARDVLAVGVVISVLNELQEEVRWLSVQLVRQSERDISRRSGEVIRKRKSELTLPMPR